MFQRASLPLALDHVITTLISINKVPAFEAQFGLVPSTVLLQISELRSNLKFTLGHSYMACQEVNGHSLYNYHELAAKHN